MVFSEPFILVTAVADSSTPVALCAILNQILEGRYKTVISKAT